MIDVRHAADREFTVRLDSIELRSEEPAVDIALRDSIFEPGTQAKLVWNQLAIPGAWRGHPAGPFELTNKESSPRSSATSTRRRIVASMIDFEHASEAPTTVGALSQQKARLRRGGSYPSRIGATDGFVGPRRLGSRDGREDQDGQVPLLLLPQLFASTPRIA